MNYVELIYRQTHPRARAFTRHDADPNPGLAAAFARMSTAPATEPDDDDDPNSGLRDAFAATSTATA